MQLKSYLRGLGCGLFISAVLMGIAVSFKKDTMSDEEIRMRATELGMVDEASVLVKPAKETEAAVVMIEDKSEDITTDKTENKSEDKTAEKTDSKTEDKTAEKTESKTEDITAEKTENKSEDITDDISGSNDKDSSDSIKTEKDEYSETVDEYDVNPPVSDEADYVEPEDTTDVKTTETITLEIAKGTTSDGVARLLAKAGVVTSASDFDDYLCRNRYDKKIHSGIFKIPPGASYQEIAEIITRGN